MSSGEEVPAKSIKRALRVKGGIAADIPPSSIRTVSGQCLESDTSEPCIHPRTPSVAVDHAEAAEAEPAPEELDLEGVQRHRPARRLG